jgi:hypothetical protein
VLDSDVRRSILAAVVVFAIIAMLAWARNDPGVGGREPDPPQSAPAVGAGDSFPSTT